MLIRRFIFVIIFYLVFFSLNLAQGADELRLTPVVRAVQKTYTGVVNVYTSRFRERNITPFDLFFEDFWPEFQPKFKEQSLGSGFVVDAKKGYVLTNAHVIEGASEIKVRFLDGREFSAELIGSDPDFDLAILHLKGSRDLPRISLGNSDDILIGETVIAIGNPYGFGHTVTTGVVSALHRSIKTKEGLFTDFIQTDAAINPGNSGGPLINVLGEVIGINTAIYKDAQGIGFAIPINKAKRAITELLERGYVQPVWIGICGQDLTPEVAAYLGLRDVYGLLITEVYPGTPAFLVGIKPGDVLLQIDNYKVEDKEKYIDLLRNFTPKEKVKLKIFRKGKIFSSTIELSSFEIETALSLVAQKWGIIVEEDKFFKGLKVVQVLPKTPASRLGLRAGDVLLKVSGVKLRNKEELGLLFSRLRFKKTLLLLVLRGDRAYYVRLRL